MIFRLLIVLVACLAILLVAQTPRAPAHPNPKGWSASTNPLHVICKAVGKCKDPVPRPGPAQPCTPANDGAIEIVWDPRLQVYVTWECRCTPQCHWRRLDITHAVGLPWAPPHKRVVMDAMRACKSIVCERVWVAHFYPTQWIFGKAAVWW